VTRDAKLSDVLSEFARTLITDFPIQGILDRLVERIVEMLPVTSAGVTLISAGEAPRFIAASDESALRYERLQSELDEGPCLRAFESSEAVSVPDLETETRFPRFAPAAIAAGAKAVFTFPLRHGDGCLGALDLYRDTRGALDEDDMAAAQTLADVAAAYLLNAQAREDAQVASDRFHHDALHDPLTGLPNRLLLLERLEHAGRRALRTRSHTAILYLDIDRFKDVNDSHGHHVGDQLLIEVGRRLTALMRSGDTLARFAGDEFVLLCEDIGSPEDADALVARIDSTFAHPFELGGRQRSVRVSVGLALSAPGEELTGELLVRADLAMYRMKHHRAAPHATDARPRPPTSRVADAVREFESDLRAALAADELDLVYQPIVAVNDGHTVGVEALLRWQHATRGPMSPIDIIRTAERSDLIDDIGAWVLRRACEDHRRWRREGGDAVHLAVNVSSRQVVSPTIAATVAEILAATDTDPNSLILELTETVLLEETDASVATLDELGALGVRLALDDFGSGYSSLRYLDRLPIDIVKIDQYFIARLTEPASSATLVTGVTQVAHELGLVVIAEGIETAEQHALVMAAGCDHGQGYFYGRPMPATAMAMALAG